jgi:hypothetical protein
VTNLFLLIGKFYFIFLSKTHHWWSASSHSWGTAHTTTCALSF